MGLAAITTCLVWLLLAEPSSTSVAALEASPVTIAIVPSLDPFALQVGSRLVRPLDLDARVALSDGHPSVEDVTLLQRDRDGQLPAIFLHALGKVPHDIERHRVRVMLPSGVSVLERVNSGPPAPITKLDGLGQARDGRYAYDLTVWRRGVGSQTARRYLDIATPAQVDASLVVHVWRGELFDRFDMPTPELVERVRSLALPLHGPITIEAHTADEGSRTQCALTSQKRAQAVRALMISLGVAESRLQAHGKGDVEPLVPNFSAKGRDENRRLVIKWPPVATRGRSEPQKAWPKDQLRLVIDGQDIRWNGEATRFFSQSDRPVVLLELGSGRGIVIDSTAQDHPDDTAVDDEGEEVATTPLTKPTTGDAVANRASGPPSADSKSAERVLMQSEVRGDLFHGGALGLDLRMAIDRLVQSEPRLLQNKPNTVRLELEVHVHGARGANAESDLMRTQREALVLMDHLSQRGIGKERVRVSARGRSSPLVPPLGTKASEYNRRVVLRVLGP